MSTNAPIEHIQESLKLNADGLIDLWEITLRVVNTTVYFVNGPSRTWQGHTYESLPCQLSGEAVSASDQNNRPTLSVINPEKIFAPFAAAGYFDLALVVRKRLLQDHYMNNVNIFQQRVWISGRPSSVTNQSIQLELRSPLDSPNFKTPVRKFSPPEFPFVVL